VMMDAMFEVPSKKVKQFDVTLQYAREQLDKSGLQEQAS
jgi:ATP-dependent clp protease, ATP-binding subunit clpX